MPEFLKREVHTFPHNSPETVILGNLPGNRHTGLGCAVESSPQNDSRWNRISRSDTQREWIRAQPNLRRARHRRQGAKGSNKLPPIHARDCRTNLEYPFELSLQIAKG
jgi:hypothetical protein